ncbi:MAG TPA: hypothetical protein VH740_08220 [Vicinamibacterales bacterium]|jgi:hypothetical protein
MTKHMSRLAFSAATILLSLGGVGALRSARQPGPPPAFSEAELFFELNDTDGDLGIHASIDGGTWTSLEIEGPNERKLLNIVSSGRLRTQGLTQLAFESAEPSFDELAPADFFRRFPEGTYEIDGLTPSGREMRAVARLSHVLAAPPEILVNGVPAADDCDAAVPLVSTPVVIDWDPVTTSHPDIGKSGPVQISRYQLFVERDNGKLSLDLPPTVTEFRVPAGVLALGKQFKLEVIARTTTGNNTAVESCFRVQ